MSYFYNATSGQILGKLHFECLRNKKVNHSQQDATENSETVQIAHDLLAAVCQNFSLYFFSSWMLLDTILLNFSFCHCYSGSWGAFMPGKYLSGSTGIENMVSQSVLLSMERA